MPGGFPPTHARFWTNQVFPWVVFAVCLTSLWAERRGQPLIRAAASVTIPALWLAATVAAVALFLQSARLFAVPACVCLILIISLFRLAFRREPIPIRKCAVAVIPAVLCGIAIVFAQRADVPDTLPLNLPVPEAEPNVDLRVATIPVRLSDRVDVVPGAGQVRVRHSVPSGESAAAVNAAANPSAESATASARVYRIEVDPLLSFESRSPDRFWTIFAPTRYRQSPPRRMTALRREERSVTAQYRDDTELMLQVDASPAGDTTTIEAGARLDRPIYSHLNSFVALTISGCRQPAVSFSPCPALRVGVEPSDYPVGRPTRLAYVDAGDVFHVVSAKSGEKGPFSEFAQGRLLHAESLTVTIFDGTTAIFRVSIDDWSSQAGHSLSPTAGWGLPVNAIEFSQIGESGSGAGAISIWFTLAGTSVGRGWDSVGHAAGTYRNRMRIETVTPDVPARK